MADKENKADGCIQKSDFGCVVCMRTSSLVDGTTTGIKMKSCSVCRGPRRYCSKNCFEKDWNELGHKDECTRLASQLSIEDPEVEAAKARQMKEDANQLFKAGNYKEAIHKYIEIKILALKIRKAVNEIRKQQLKSDNVENVHLNKHLQFASDIDSKFVEEIKFYRRTPALGNEMARLAAIAANNTAITYNKMKNGIQASAAAREALKIDPLFADRILPQLISAMQSLGPSDELSEMLNRYSLYNAYKASCGESIALTTALFDLKFISYNQLTKKSYQHFYEMIDKEKKLTDEGKGRLTDPFCMHKDGDKWGHVNVIVAIIPFSDAQWVSLGIESIKYIFRRDFVEYQNLRIKPADLRGSGDDVDYELHCHKPGSISHVGSMEALKNAHREVVLFVNDLEREGLLVSSVTVGAGLFNLLPENKDPQKQQRRHKGRADKYILYPGHYLPEHCKIIPAMNHIRSK